MTRTLKLSAIAALSLIAVAGAASSANASTCKIVYGHGAHSNPIVATSIARRDLQARIRRYGRGGIISSHIARRRLSRNPTIWRVYAGARFCTIQLQQPPRRARGPILPRRSR